LRLGVFERRFGRCLGSNLIIRDANKFGPSGNIFASRFEAGL
jgi:hypothetical protein